MLRLPRETDLPLVERWRCDPAVHEQLVGSARAFTQADLQTWLETSVRSDSLIRFMIDDSEHEATVGYAGLYRIDIPNSHAEYGILIGERGYWRQGIGTRATQAMLRLAFEHLGLNRVYLEVLASNLPARGTYRKCGFRNEGVARRHVCRDGGFTDVVHMGILAGDFQSAP